MVKKFLITVWRFILTEASNPTSSTRDSNLVKDPLLLAESKYDRMELGRPDNSDFTHSQALEVKTE